KVKSVKAIYESFSFKNKAFSDCFYDKLIYNGLLVGCVQHQRVRSYRSRVIFEMTSLLLMISLYTLPFLIIALILRLKKRTPKLHYVSLGLLLFLLILIFTVYQ